MVDRAIPGRLDRSRRAGPEARYDTLESIALSSWPDSTSPDPAASRARPVDVLGFSQPRSPRCSTPHRRRSTARSSGPRWLATLKRPTRDTSRSPHGAEVVDRLIDAIQQGDLDRVVALLTDDASLKMPPEPFQSHGPRTIAHFLQQVAFWRDDLKMVTTRANNDPAFGYTAGTPTPTSMSRWIFVSTISETRSLR